MSEMMLQLLRECSEPGGPVRLVTCVGALSSGAHESIADPTTRFWVQVGRGDPRAIEAAAAGLGPAAHHAFVEAEAWLARLDPQWAWRLIQRHVDATRGGHLGLSVAARAPDLDVSAGRAPASLFGRQLAYDNAARRAIRGGDISDAIAEACRGEWREKAGVWGFQASTILAGAGALAPQAAVAAAHAMLEFYEPVELQQALSFVARQVCKAGAHELLEARIDGTEFILEKIAWLEAYAQAGAPLSAALFDPLAARVEEHCARDDLGSGAWPLIRTAAFAGEHAALLQLARRFELAAGWVLEALFEARVDARASAAIEFLAAPSRLAQLSDNDPDGPAWWRQAHALGQTQRAAKALATLAARFPWQPTPDSLEAILGLPA